MCLSQSQRNKEIIKRTDQIFSYPQSRGLTILQKNTLTLLEGKIIGSTSITIKRYTKFQTLV